MASSTAWLTFKSLDRMLARVRQYQTDFLVKTTLFMERLAEYGAERATEVFGPSISVSTVQIDETTYAVVANGEQVCFLEFGTGVWAGNGHPYADTATVKVYPGSWSEEHKETWKHWNEAGKDPYAYPYNHVPRYAMLTAYTEMRDHAYEIAKEVFGK